MGEEFYFGVQEGVQVRAWGVDWGGRGVNITQDDQRLFPQSHVYISQPLLARGVDWGGGRINYKTKFGRKKYYPKIFWSKISID